jgi:sulfate adenylyltransferase subunit 1 (EFTu-like GTPase family)
VLCVNKMDLVDYDADVFESIKEEFKAFATKLDITDLTFIPISALHGDNVVHRSANMPWYEGTSLLHHLERPVPRAVRPAPDERQVPRLPRLRGHGGRRCAEGR